jgi:hypothetical protein
LKQQPWFRPSLPPTTNSDDKLKEFQKRALVKYAGYAAEVRFMKKRLQYFLLSNNPENDYNKVYNEVMIFNREVVHSQIPDLCFYLWEKTTRQIIRNKKVWQCIEDIATRLDQVGLLRSEELFQITSKLLFNVQHLID